jgi:hypothetical protein
MKAITKILDLKPDATEEEICAAIAALQKSNQELDAQVDQSIKHIGSLEKKLASIPQKEAVDPRFTELVAQKMAAGLPRATAEEAAKNQIEHDAAEKKAAKK